MARILLGAFFCGLAGAVLIAPAIAQSDNSGVRVALGGKNARTTLSASIESGVRVWRPAAAASAALAGAAPPRAARVETEKSVILIRVVKNPARRLRTQGFYTGYGRNGRAFTQGFYSDQRAYRRQTYD